MAGIPLVRDSARLAVREVTDDVGVILYIRPRNTVAPHLYVVVLEVRVENCAKKDGTRTLRQGDSFSRAGRLAFRNAKVLLVVVGDFAAHLL